MVENIWTKTSQISGQTCKEGHQKEWTTPYISEQNGVAEQKNRTIVGATKAMLYDQDLPKFLWVEACNTTMYI